MSNEVLEWALQELLLDDCEDRKKERRLQLELGAKKVRRIRGSISHYGPKVYVLAFRTFSRSTNMGDFFERQFLSSYLAWDIVQNQKESR